MGTFIRLLDSSGTKVLDSVSGEYEDSFCLETFADLARMHYEAPPPGTKCSIIARVQTWDPKQPERAYYSYYNAFDLNKILFQTQVYLGKKLIHRLHVLNPLTNTDIIGNVCYFMVKYRPPGSAPSPEEEEGATGPRQSESAEDEQKEKSDGEAVGDSAGTERDEKMVADSSGEPDGKLGANHQQQQRGGRPRKKGGAVAPINTHLRNILNIPPPSPAVREVEAGLQMWTMSAPAVTMVTEEQPGPLSPMKLGERLRKLSFTPTANGRRISFLNTSPFKRDKETGKTPRSALLPMEEDPEKGKTTNAAEAGDESIPIRRRANSYAFASTKEKDAMSPSNASGPASAPPRRHTTINYELTKLPTKPLSLKNNRRITKTPVAPGSITRFAVPLTKEELARVAPPIPRSRRRSLSYANAVTATGHRVTFSEWLEMIKAEQKRLANAMPGKDDSNKDFDDLPTFREAAGNATSPKRSPGKRNHPLSPSSPLKRSLTPPKEVKGESSTDLVSPPEEESDSASTSSSQDTENIVYDAILFATDNDFLEFSKIRAVFRDNAIQPEDARLFEMPPYTGTENEPVPVTVLLDDQNPVCEFCYPSRAALEQQSPFMRTFHKLKCYVLAVALMVGLFLLVYFNLEGTRSRTTVVN
ncbi:hypothetical protein HK102_007726 [Quaeritorhiza haematococci]|nr:hypothetical protein HK102_007726 [Quaeritorhiza haematococci]